MFFTQLIDAHSFNPFPANVRGRVFSWCDFCRVIFVPWNFFLEINEGFFGTAPQVTCEDETLVTEKILLETFWK